MPCDAVDEEAGLHVTAKVQLSAKRSLSSSGQLVTKQAKFEQPHHHTLPSGASAYSPISVDSESSDTVLEIVFNEADSATYCKEHSVNILTCHTAYSGTYCPVSSDRIISSIIVKGLEGIWRLLSCKSHVTYDAIAEEMDNELCKQPELQEFFLTEVQSGGTVYLQAQMNGKTEVAL
ncbi:uncharacterized protein [Dysidea avara]|uniref:uncharacterized protein isoform X1 n=1 Tax=Dysidea avara TaxID=196820 RepID=UPI00332AE0C9